MKFLVLALAISLAACTTTQQAANVDQPVKYACATATAAIGTLTVANRAGKLSPANETKVTQAIGYVVPVCHSKTVPTLSTLEMQAFMDAVQLLSTQAAGVK